MSTPEQMADGLQAASGEIVEAAERVLRFASARIGGRAIGTYMKDAKGHGRRSPMDAGPLRIVSGRLARSLATRGTTQDTGGQPEGIMEITVSGSTVTLTKGSKVPYAAIHEYGGTAGRLRRARIPARPYLRPALTDELPAITAKAKEELLEVVATSLRGAS